MITKTGSESIHPSIHDLTRALIHVSSALSIHFPSLPPRCSHRCSSPPAPSAPVGDFAGDRGVEPGPGRSLAGSLALQSWKLWSENPLLVEEGSLPQGAIVHFHDDFQCNHRWILAEAK